MTHRDTIFVEDAKILECEKHPGDQVILRLHAPEMAAHALPGQFTHIQCDPALPMRRPLSLMRVNAKQGWVDIDGLYQSFNYRTGFCFTGNPDNERTIE